MQILVSIGAVGGGSHQIGEILPPCDLFVCPVLSLPFSRTCAMVEPVRFSHFMAQTTCFRTRMVLLWVRTTGDLTDTVYNVLPITAHIISQLALSVSLCDHH